MSFETLDQPKSMFDTEFDYEEIIEIPDDFLQVRLGEMENKEIFTGKPQITGSIQTREFEIEDEFDVDGNPKTRKVHQLRMVVTNKEEEQYLDININLKSDDLKVTNIRKGSVLFDLISSIHELENRGSMKGKNIIKTANLKQYIDFINGLEIIGIQNVERKGTYHFNSFYVVQVNNKKLKAE